MHIALEFFFFGQLYSIVLTVYTYSSNFHEKILFPKFRLDIITTLTNYSANITYFRKHNSIHTNNNRKY